MVVVVPSSRDINDQTAADLPVSDGARFIRIVEGMTMDVEEYKKLEQGSRLIYTSLSQPRMSQFEFESEPAMTISPGSTAYYS